MGKFEAVNALSLGAFDHLQLGIEDFVIFFFLAIGFILVLNIASMKALPTP